MELDKAGHMRQRYRAAQTCRYRRPSQARAYGPGMDERKLLIRFARGELANVAFGDRASPVWRSLGFELRRVSSSHHVFAHPDIAELLNLQSVRGQAKPYQLRQLMRLVERYDLSG